MEIHGFENAFKGTTEAFLCFLPHLQTRERRLRHGKMKFLLITVFAAISMKMKNRINLMLFLLKFIPLSVSLWLLVAWLGVHRPGCPVPVKMKVEEGDGWWIRAYLSSLLPHCQH